MAAGSVLKPVYLSLGSNMGDRLGALQTAVNKLHRPDLLITKISSIYETAPVDLKEQPDFLNVVVQAETSLYPLRLLHRIQIIERDMGRKRSVPKGPRVIDIDILLHGSSVVDTSQLQIPHPRMPQRRFVLTPLAEIAAELRHPVTRQSLKELLAVAPHQLIRRTPLCLELPGSGNEE
jgi:2-amino-4-hydroxy-6-hydroxymethyldihydropteridine diphosphokinase